MLTSKQVRFLRAAANGLKPIFQVGKDGLSYNFFNTLNDSLKAHELIKISLLKTCPLTSDEVISVVCDNLNCEAIQKIGRVIVFFRASEKRKYDLKNVK